MNVVPLPPVSAGRNGKAAISKTEQRASSCLLILFTILLFIVQITLPARVLMWFTSPVLKPHEAESALNAVCLNRSCKAQGKGIDAGIAILHVKGVLSRNSKLSARIFRTVVVDGIDTGMDKEAELWYWNLKSQMSDPQKRFIKSATLDYGTLICLTNECTNSKKFQIGKVMYTVKESSKGSMKSIGTRSLYDKLCQHLAMISPSYITSPETLITDVNGRFSGSEELYHILASSMNLTIQKDAMSAHEMYAYFKCPSKGILFSNTYIYRGLVLGEVIKPSGFSIINSYLMDYTYQIGYCKKKSKNAYEHSAYNTYVAGHGGFAYTFDKSLYGDKVSSWTSGSLLPGYESIVDAKKMVNYIDGLQNLKEYFLRRKLNINHTDVIKSKVASTSRSRTIFYSFKYAIMKEIIPANYSVPFPGGVHAHVGYPIATNKTSKFLQSSITFTYLMDYETNNLVETMDSFAYNPDVPGNLTYLQMDILSSMSMFPGIEVVVQKLLNKTIDESESLLCNSYATYMYKRRKELNIASTYTSLCAEMFTAYREWKKNNTIPPQPIRENLPEFEEIIYYNNDASYKTKDIELVSALFTSVETGNARAFYEGLVKLRIGFRGFSKLLNETHGIIETEKKARLYYIQHSHYAKEKCTTNEVSFFISPLLNRICKVIALLAGIIISIGFIPAFYSYLKSSFFDKCALRIRQTNDVMLRIVCSVSRTRIAITVFSLCSALVSRVRPVISWDPWYVDLGTSIDLNWVSWFLTASASGMWLYSFGYIMKDVFGFTLGVGIGLVTPSLVNLLIPLTRVLVDSLGWSTVQFYQDDFAAAYSPLSLGILEILICGTLYGLTLVFTRPNKKRKSHLSINKLEPYEAAASCYSKISQGSLGAVPGWVLTLGGYRCITENGIDYLIKNGFQWPYKDSVLYGIPVRATSKWKKLVSSRFR